MELTIVLENGEMQYYTVADIDIDLKKRELVYWEVVGDTIDDIADGVTLDIDTLSSIRIKSDIP